MPASAARLPYPYRPEPAVLAALSIITTASRRQYGTT